MSKIFDLYSRALQEETTARSMRYLIEKEYEKPTTHTDGFLAELEKAFNNKDIRMLRLLVTGSDPESMTINRLRSMAKEKKLKRWSVMSRNELIVELNEVGAFQ